MSFQKLNSNSYCVGGRHRSSTVKGFGDITSKGSKVLIGYCSFCIRKKSMEFNDNTIKAEGMCDFLKNVSKKGLFVSKKMAKSVLKDPGRVLEVRANIGIALPSRNSKAASSSIPKFIKFYHTGKGLYLGKIVQIMFI